MSKAYTRNPLYAAPYRPCNAQICSILGDTEILFLNALAALIIDHEA